jgi:hypothetical protein
VANEQVLLRQRYALATLWFQTPANFALRPSAGNTWGTSVDVCEWSDVYCGSSDGDNRHLVESLQLGSVGLQGGHIPVDLGLLTSLMLLDLTSNKLAGTIPSSWGHLALQNNDLTGTIPSTLGSLTSMKILTLQGCNLTGAIPSTLGNLTRLESLYLHAMH